ncbi:MAG TPA: hypothetical protein VFE44_04530, partial [Thermoanaerobaculia bacterium]|nr:hypothetical protein [Thermoanaerobaculia bacterium]
MRWLHRRGRDPLAAEYIYTAPARRRAGATLPRLIDLSRTRAELAAAIAAGPRLGDPRTDPTDPRVFDSDARLLLRGHTREELFPVLEAVFSERFAAVPRGRLLRDLLVPLRSALGNAHKRGNRGDAAKSISVETVLTRKGALLGITDQGEGFDVADVLGHRRKNQRYFAHRGAGFSRFDRADSIVTYENGGRTLLLGFVAPGYDGRSSEVDAVLYRVTDPAWLRSRFAADLPELGLGDARLESLRVSVIGSAAGGGRDLRYVLRVGEDGSPPRLRVLSGRLHTDAGAADA